MRECGECTMCCRGWIPADINGQILGITESGLVGCSHVCETGCSIYKDRPKNPCETYRCAWLQDEENFPDWLRPDKCGAILSLIEIRNSVTGKARDFYFEVTECGVKLDSDVLNWVLINMIAHGFWVDVSIGGNHHYYGPPEFVRIMEDKIMRGMKNES